MNEQSEGSILEKSVSVSGRDQNLSDCRWPEIRNQRSSFPKLQLGQLTLIHGMHAPSCG